MTLSACFSVETQEATTVVAAKPAPRLGLPGVTAGMLSELRKKQDTVKQPVTHEVSFSCISQLAVCF